MLMFVPRTLAAHAYRRHASAHRLVRALERVGFYETGEGHHDDADLARVGGVIEIELDAASLRE
jgi:hypothetical protein